MFVIHVYIYEDAVQRCVISLMNSRRFEHAYAVHLLYEIAEIREVSEEVDGNDDAFITRGHEEIEGDMNEQDEREREFEGTWCAGAVYEGNDGFPTG